MKHQERLRLLEEVEPIVKWLSEVPANYGMRNANKIIETGKPYLKKLLGLKKQFEEADLRIIHDSLVGLTNSATEPNLWANLGSDWHRKYVNPLNEKFLEKLREAREINDLYEKSKNPNSTSPEVQNELAPAPAAAPAPKGMRKSNVTFDIPATDARVDLSNPQAVQSLLQEVSREAKSTVDENRKAAVGNSANQMVDRQSVAAARAIDDEARKVNRLESAASGMQKGQQTRAAEQELERLGRTTRQASPAAQAAAPAPVAQADARAPEVEDDLRNQSPTQIYNLGRDYLYGLNGKIKSPAKGIELFNLADSLGSPLAPFALGQIYQKGTAGIAPDPAKAREYFQQSFTRGYRPTEFAPNSVTRTPYEEAISALQNAPAEPAPAPAPAAQAAAPAPVAEAPLTAENLRALNPQRGTGYTPDVETASTYRTMQTGERDTAARALANLQREERLNASNPYTQPLYRRNAPEMRAARTDLRRADDDVQNQILNDIAPEFVRHSVESIPEGVDTEAGAREQAIKMMLNLLNHHEQDFPIEQMFAADDPNKLLAEEQIVDFLKARYNLSDPAKLQKFMDRSHQRDASIGKTYQELMNEESIIGKSDPYLQAGVKPISPEDLNAFSSQNTQSLNDVFRRQALERYNEEAQERRESFENNLRNQFGGFNWFNSLRREKQKQFENQERKMRRDLDDRLMREERMRDLEERQMGAKLLSDERQRNLTGADQMGKLASVSNIARASAASNMQAFNDMQERKHLGALDTRRTLGQAQTDEAQNKLNARLQQKRAMEEANRRRPAELLGQLQGAPFTGLPYSAAPLPTPKPLNSMGQDVRDINRMPQQATPAGANAASLVGPAVELARNIFGGNK